MVRWKVSSLFIQKDNQAAINQLSHLSIHIHLFNKLVSQQATQLASHSLIHCSI